MQIFEYSLKLGTGETIDVAEIAMGALDAWSKQAFDDQAAGKSIAGILLLCTKVPRQAVEDAKIGYAKPLERLLRTPPAGALLKLDRPACANISDCAMADAHKCTTLFASVSVKFPECWDYDLASGSNFTDPMAAAQEVAKTIVMAWRDGRHVVISV